MIHLVRPMGMSPYLYIFKSVDQYQKALQHIHKKYCVYSFKREQCIVIRLGDIEKDKQALANNWGNMLLFTLQPFDLTTVAKS